MNEDQKAKAKDGKSQLTRNNLGLISQCCKAGNITQQTAFSTKQISALSIVTLLVPNGKSQLTNQSLMA